MKPKFKQEVQVAWDAYLEGINDPQILAPLILLAQSGGRPPQYIVEYYLKPWPAFWELSWTISKSGPWAWSWSRSRSIARLDSHGPPSVRKYKSLSKSGITIPPNT